MIPGHVRLRRFITLVSQTNLIVMCDRLEHLLHARMHHGVSKTGKDRIDRCRRQFHRNATSEANQNRGVCFDVLGVLQSFPGAESECLDTTKFFTDVHTAQTELVAWASTVVPAMRENVMNAIQHLNNKGPGDPVDIASLAELMPQVEQTLDVHRHCSIWRAPRCQLLLLLPHPIRTWIRMGSQGELKFPIANLACIHYEYLIPR